MDALLALIFITTIIMCIVVGFVYFKEKKDYMDSNYKSASGVSFHKTLFDKGLFDGGYYGSS